MCRMFLGGKHSSSFLLFVANVHTQRTFEEDSKIDDGENTFILRFQVFLFYSGSEMRGMFHASLLLSFMLHIIIHYLPSSSINHRSR